MGQRGGCGFMVGSGVAMGLIWGPSFPPRLPPTGPINREMRHLISSLQNHNHQLKGDVQRYKRKLREVQAEIAKVGGASGMGRGFRVEGVGLPAWGRDFLGGG